MDWRGRQGLDRSNQHKSLIKLAMCRFRFVALVPHIDFLKI